MKLLAGNSNRPLAEAIGQYLHVPFTNAVVRRFADMEVFVEIQENVRGEDMFVIQSTSFGPHRAGTPSGARCRAIPALCRPIRRRRSGRESRRAGEPIAVWKTGAPNR